MKNITLELADRRNLTPQVSYKTHFYLGFGMTGFKMCFCKIEFLQRYLFLSIDYSRNLDDKHLDDNLRHSSLASGCLKLGEMSPTSAIQSNAVMEISIIINERDRHSQKVI